MRGILAEAAFEGYLRWDNHKLLTESQEVASFSVDLLKAVKDALKHTVHLSIGFKDPIRGRRIRLE